MKKSILYLLFMLMSTLCLTQSEALLSFAPELCDSLLMIQKEDGALTRYYDVFKKLRKELVSKKDRELYRDARVFLDWLPSAKHSDSASIRIQYMSYGYPALKIMQDINNAQFAYQAAHDFGGDLKDDTYVWYVENVLASIYNMKGNHELSEYYYNILIAKLNELIENSDGPSSTKYNNYLARSYNQLGYLYNWVGKYEQGEQIISKGYNLSKQQQNYLGIISASSFLVHNYLETDRPELIPKYLEEIKQSISKIDSNRRPEKYSLYYNYLGQYFLHKNELEKAITAFNKVDSIAITNNLNLDGRDYAKTQSNLSKCYLDLNQLQNSSLAITKGLKAIGIVEEDIYKPGFIVPDENAFAELAENKSDLFQFKFQTTNSPSFLDSAQIVLHRAIEVFEALRDQYLLDGSQLQSIAENKRLVKKAVDILWKRYEITHDQSLLPEALQLFNRSKNLLAARLENQRQTFVSLPQATRDKISQKQDQILDWTVRMEGTKQIDKNQFQDSIVEFRKHIRDLTGNITRIDAISRDQNYVEYLWGTEELYSIDNTKGKLNFQKLLALKKLKPMLIRSQKGMLKKDTSKSFYVNQHLLFQSLLGHVNIDRQLTIYSDEHLNYLSFPALVDDIDSQTFLIEQCLINMGSFIKSNNYDSNNSNLTTINPSYPKVVIKEIERGKTLYHLPYAQEEIKSIIQEWKGNTASYQSLTKSDFFEIFGKNSWLHYSGHSLMDQNKVYLAIGADSSEWVSQTEITKSPSSYEKVILSSCETGLGEIVTGEGVNSLANSFLLNGTRSIIYSLWTVNDQTTASLMKYLYQNQDLPFYQALGNAQRTYLNTSNEQFKHPYYWAAFVATDRSLTNIIKFTSLKWVLLIGGSFFLLFLLLKNMYYENTT